MHADSRRVPGRCVHTGWRACARRWQLLCAHRQDGHRTAHVLLAPAAALAIALGKHDGVGAWPQSRLEGCSANGNAEPAILCSGHGRAPGTEMHRDTLRARTV
jgi:hypothetical protein